MRRVLQYFVAIALLLLAQESSAQQRSPQSGQRIRITSWSLGFRPLAATFEGVNGDTLRVLSEADGTALAIPLDSVNQVEVQQGRRSLWGEGAVLGVVVVGVGLGALSAALYEEPEPCTGGLCPSWEIGKGGMFAFGFVGGALLGGVVGGFIGKLVETDRWEEVPLDRLRVSFAPKRGGFSLAMGVAF